MMMKRISVAGPLCVVILGLFGCQQEKVADVPDPGPDYSRPLGPGESALRLITDPQRMPDLAKAWETRDARFGRAARESLVWFAAPSSHRSFPFEGITHEQAHASVIAMLDLMEHSPSAYAFEADMKRMFDAYESVGYDGKGVVLYTGYYSPDFRASRRQTREFTHALYKRPDDLVTDPQTGTPLGKQVPGGGVVPYDTRASLEASGRLDGTELVWVEDALSAYLIHVNGSAKLRLPDGEIMYIGYAGKTDRPYYSLGRAIIEAGLLREDEVNLQSIRHLYRRQPDEVEKLMRRNESYVFFTEYEGDRWPSGSLGVRVTGESSLATDKSIYPRGGVVLVDTDTFSFSGQRRPFHRFMLDQDTGGAIKAPGRADIFLGIGERVGILAGQQKAEGRLYYFILKQTYIEQYTP